MTVSEFQARLIQIEVRLMQAWVIFRETHDIQDAKISCCDRIVELFDALQSMENFLQEAKQKMKEKPHGPSNLH